VVDGLLTVALLVALPAAPAAASALTVTVAVATSPPFMKPTVHVTFWPLVVVVPLLVVGVPRRVTPAGSVSCLSRKPRKRRTLHCHEKVSGM